MSQPKDLGLFLPQEKKFYFLEAGDNWIGNTIDRIKKTLIQRGLIKLDFDMLQKQMNYDIMSKEEAIRKDYECVPIYISKHIQAIYENKSTPEGTFK
jgi:hypothetical protein